MTSTSPTHIVEISGITKRFPGVLALDKVSLGFRPGEVHAVVGENGAGKSTLMNIMAGDLQPTEGELRIDGKPVRFRSALDSRAAGIVVVYQELALCPTLSVAENIMMSTIPGRSPMSLVPRAEMRRQARAALARLGMGALDPDTKVWRLSIAEMQLVEIAGAIRQNARVLVLDEPNSALSPRESERLFDIVRQLRAEGVTVIYVSHHLREVLAIADRVTVMRDGRVIETIDNDNVSEDRLDPRHGRPRPRQHDDPGRSMPAADAAGADIALSRAATSPRPASTISASTSAPARSSASAGFRIPARTASARRCSASSSAAAASASRARNCRARDPSASIRNGMAFVPADRRGAGGLLSMSVADNVVSASLSRFSLAGMLRRGAIRREARAQVARLDARISHLAQKLGTLVGRQPAEDHPRPQPGDQSARARSCTSRRAASMSAPRPRSIRSCAASPAKGWRCS